jgi:DNA invertase Pin-like site-specific DNA recombinase
MSVQQGRQPAGRSPARLHQGRGIDDDRKDGFPMTEALDTTTIEGRLAFRMLGAPAEFERSLMRERIPPRGRRKPCTIGG